MLARIRKIVEAVLDLDHTLDDDDKAVIMNACREPKGRRMREDRRQSQGLATMSDACSYLNISKATG